MKSVFFYGLFMDEKLLREKTCTLASPALAYVDDYELRIGKRATLVKSAGHRAYGLVTDISTEDLSVLYAEPSVADYEPETMLVQELSGKHRKGVSYLLPREKLSGTNYKYAASLAKVAVKLGLPQFYINEITTWAGKNA